MIRTNTSDDISHERGVRSTRDQSIVSHMHAQLARISRRMFFFLYALFHSKTKLIRVYVYTTVVAQLAKISQRPFLFFF